MSRGISKLQRAIVGLLDGTIEMRVYRGSGVLTTSELLEKLRGRGLVREVIPRKTAMFTVRRACLSLLDRDILEGEYVTDVDHHWAQAASWRLKEREGPA